MNLEVNVNKVLIAVLLYPAILFFPNILGQEGFWLTAPYFFVVFLFLLSFILLNKRSVVKKDSILVALLLLFAIAVFNFTSIRYSLPLFFTLYGLMLFVFISTIEYRTFYSKNIEYALYLYFLLSLPFLLSSIGYVHQGRFAGFVGSPTIYAGFMTIVFIISSLRLRLFSIKYISFYALTLLLVYLTKTRLILAFLMVYPFLRELILRKKWFTRKRLFVIFYGITLSIYPLYVALLDWFPNLLTMRYSGKADTSFGLRNYLFVQSQQEYLNGSGFQMWFGKGNEKARSFILELMTVDYMPHNDYLRLLIDWGVVGFLVFSFLLYKLAVKNDYTLFLALTYMVLFYSNMVFNLFVLSLLIIFYFKKEKTKLGQNA